MKYKLLITVLFVAIATTSTARSFGRGFGGGFHGGGFGGGGGGFGGGSFHGGNFGGGSRGGEFGGGGSRGGEFGGGGFGAGGSHNNFGGGEFGGFRGGNNSGLGGMFGGDGIRGAGGMSGDGMRGAGGMAGDGFRGAGGLSNFGNFASERGGSLPTSTSLSSFLGLPTDMGMHQGGGMEHAFGYTGDSRGLSAFNPSAAGEHGASFHQYTGPNGTTIDHGSIGERGAAVGPNGAAGGERGARGTVVEGPNGTTIAHGAAGERGGAIGPNGAAGGARAASGTAVKGPNGNTIAHGEAGERGAAIGPNGAVGGSRAVSGTVARGANGGEIAHGSAVTRNWSAADLRVQGNYVRGNFNNYNCFNHGWYDHHPGAWWAGYGAGVWSAANWSAVNSWFGDGWPIYGYMYGNDLTYVDNNVCLYGQPIATADEYYQSASNLVQTGVQAQIPNTPPPADPTATADDPKWLALGVFEAIQPGEKSSKMLMQLSVNKNGIIRGNYYNTGDENTQLIEGSIDKQTSRAAWIVKDKQDVVFDTGLYNLTQDDSPVLVHIGKEKNEQWTLVRLKQPANGVGASGQ